jgi:hypothetical protein
MGSRWSRFDVVTRVDDVKTWPSAPLGRVQRPVATIDHRMESFIAWHGEVPPEAKRLEDFEARAHAASWIRRLIGKGIACSYVIGCQLGERWWTFCFERSERAEYPIPEGAERWCVEAYKHDGQSWSENYYYWPAGRRWRHVRHAEFGKDFGRHGAS